MFDFLRDLGKSAEEKRQEWVNAYLDGELSPGEAGRFEAELQQDPALRTELGQLRQIKASIQQLPQVRAPRNYTLDPAVYGAPAPRPAAQWLPAVRVATALAAFFFILTVVLDLMSPVGQMPFMAGSAGEAEVADVAVEEVEVEGEAVEVTRVVTEMAEAPMDEEGEAGEEPAALVAPPTGEVVEEEEMAVEEAAEEAAEAMPEAIEEAEEEAATEAADTGPVEEPAEIQATAAAPSGGGGPTPAPTATEEEAPARLMEAYPADVAEEEARATETAAIDLDDQDEAMGAEEEPEVEPSSPFSALRIAQVVLGFLLAGLIVAWALIRR